MAYTATIMRKGTRVEVAETIREYWELVFDGFRPDGEAPDLSPPPFSTQQTEALSATIATGVEPVRSRGVGRFLTRARSGENLTVAFLGDSMLAGVGLTNAATEGAAALLATDLTARFPGTVTATNRAAGGRTMLTMFTFSHIETALADKADLYIIGGGRNDAQIYFGTQGGEYGPGYPTAPSIAARERLIRMIRDRVPKADIILTTESPYKASTGGSTNPVIRAYYDEVERLAAEYGCEFVDVYDAVFERAGGYDDLMQADGVHPNAAGHGFMADVILDHIPADYRGAVVAPGRPPSLATRKPGEVDSTKARLGYVVVGATVQPGLSFAKTGAGWAGTAPHATSGAGDYIEYTFTGTELHVNMSLALADAPIFNVSVDGVTTKTNANPRLAGSSINSYVPVALGLTPATHVVRVTLVSGALKINEAAALIGPGSDLGGTSVAVDLTGTTSVLTLSSAGAVSYALYDVSVPLPAGWSAMDVDFSIWMQARVSGETTTWREFQFVLRRSTGPFVILSNIKDAIPPVPAAGVVRRAVTLSETDAGRTASQLYRLEAYATGTDKTSQFIDSWKVTAVCRRIA